MRAIDPRSPDVMRRVERAVGLLAREPRVQLVYLFGSTVDRDRSAVRDIDFAVLADPPFTLDELTKRRAELVTQTGLPLDLISLHDASVILAFEVAETGRCLYSSAPDVEVEFVTRARARYWDFKPYREEQWRLTAERLAERGGGSQA